MSIRSRINTENGATKITCNGTNEVKKKSIRIKLWRQLFDSIDNVTEQLYEFATEKNDGILRRHNFSSQFSI